MEIKPELISSLVDGEVPSPWNEKLLARVLADPKARSIYESYMKARSIMAADDEQLSARIADRKEAFYGSLVKSIESSELSRGRPASAGISRLWSGVLRIPVPAAIAATFVIFFGVIGLVGDPTAQQPATMAAQSQPPALVQTGSAVSNPAVQTLYSTQLEGLQITADQEALLRRLLSADESRQRQTGPGIDVTVNLADVDQLLQLLQGASQIREITIDIPASAAAFEIFGEPALSRAGGSE